MDTYNLGISLLDFHCLYCNPSDIVTVKQRHSNTVKQLHSNDTVTQRTVTQWTNSVVPLIRGIIISNYFI